jgi:hypothetical protein
MKRFLSLRLKIFLLITLIGLTAHLGLSAAQVKACKNCVALQGALCVGCTGGDANGFKECSPDQSTCSCTVSGANQCNKDTEGEEGGPVG